MLQKIEIVELGETSLNGYGEGFNKAIRQKSHFVSSLYVSLFKIEKMSSTVS